MAEPTVESPAPQLEEVSFVSGLISELTSPINVVLIVVCGLLVYRILKMRSEDDSSEKNVVVDTTPKLPKMKKRDFTVDELKEFDGVKNSDGRILVAVNGKVLDVSTGKKLYGPGAPYSCYAGRDASRGLATFSLGKAPEGYDDLSDLKPVEMDSLREWEDQLSEKYDCIGRLLKPGEKPTQYFDDEDSPNKSECSSPETDAAKDS